MLSRIFLLLFFLTIKNSLEAQSQPGTKEYTICLPVPLAKRLQTNSALYKLTDSLLKISEAQLVQVKAQRDLCEDEQVELRNNYNLQIDNLNQQVHLYIEQVKGYESLTTRLNRQLKFQKGLVKGSIAVIAIAAVKIFLVRK